MTIPAVGVHGNRRVAFVAELILVLVTFHAGFGQALLEDLVVGLGMILVHAVADDLVTC